MFVINFHYGRNNKFWEQNREKECKINKKMCIKFYKLFEKVTIKAQTLNNKLNNIFHNGNI